MEIALRDMGLDTSMISAIHDMLDFIDDTEKPDDHPQHPSKTYIRDTKAMRATPADIIEYPNAYHFVVDMPGLNPDQIKVNLEDGNVLVVTGERRRENDDQNAKFIRMERRVGKLLKKFILPENANSEKKRKQTDWLVKMRSALMVVASLVATVAFQSGLSLPGGVWASDYVVDSNGNTVDIPHYAGQSVMAINLPEAYGQFLIFNTISFLASLSIILIQVSGLPLRRHRWMWTQLVIMWTAITAQSITYFISFVNLSPNRLQGTLNHVTRISVLLWLALMGTVFIGNVVRVILYVRRKHAHVKENVIPTTKFKGSNNK